MEAGSEGGVSVESYAFADLEQSERFNTEISHYHLVINSTSSGSRKWKNVSEVQNTKSKKKKGKRLIIMIMLLSLQEDALLEGNFGFHNRFGKVMNVQTN